MALITLTSDIGSPDYLVGAIKAQLLQLVPNAQIIDISHAIPPFNYPQASYVCRSAIQHFPSHTFHVILVDLFAKPSDHLILAFHQNQYFLCANNGLLSMILEGPPEMVVGINRSRYIPERSRRTRGQFCRKETLTAHHRATIHRRTNYFH
jgi:S-adenosylmethionine hydrolase